MSRKTTTIRRKPDGRFVTTVPKETGDVLGLEAAALSYRVDSRSSFSALVEARAEEEPGAERVTRQVSKSSRGQYQVVIPNGLADAMRLRDAEVSWEEKSRDRVAVTVESRGGTDE